MEEDGVDTEVLGEKQHSVSEGERDIIEINPGTSQPNTSVPGTSQPRTSNLGPVHSPFLEMYLQGLTSVESDNEEQEEPTPPTDSMDASLFQSLRGLRKKPWTKIEGRAPWTREDP